MAKSYNQKAKILYLERMMQKTGEDRAMTMQQILEELLSYGIKAERKSIYDDFESLRSFGMDIQYRRGKNGGYYLASSCVQNLQQVQKEAADFHWKTEGAGREDGKKMKLLFQDSLMDEVNAYFGETAEYKEKSTGEWTVTAELLENARFFGWLTAMGSNIYIKKPKKLAQQYRDYLKSLLKEYKNI